MDESNKRAHHTDMYNSSELILRRGQSCRITLEFNKPLADWQSIVFTVQTGPKNSEYQNTSVEFALSSSWTSGMWSAVLESSPGNSLRIIMSSPANAIIGRYDLSVQISVRGQTSTYSLGRFILLFNPWCLDDEVYLANEEERKEYILNDHGIIFMGNDKQISGIGWNYGQFENNILNICLTILDRSLNYQKDPAADCSQRHSPIYVGRVISAMINSNDDFGVLEGKWEKDFSDGVDPNSWNGSVEILWKWFNENFKPVKYGQCWVFAAVMCTVLRCLGIPTRIITNFNSAHNTDGNMVIDMHYDPEGKFLEVSNDSIWNFHVWNESWFIRRDLGLFYSGWQVLDSTPQEQSQGVYRCGPTSVIAVKEGDLHIGYDTPFVFAEVNADRVTWIVHKDGSKEKAHSDSKYVGQNISTKAVGNDDRVDVTHNYKYAEGSPEERDVFEKASRNITFYRRTPENVTANRNNTDNRRRNNAPLGRLSSSTPNLLTSVNGRPAVINEPVNSLSPATSTGNLARSRRAPPTENSFRPSPSSPAPARNAAPSYNGPDIVGKFQLLNSVTVGEDIDLVLTLQNRTVYHRPVKVNLSASSVLYTGRRINDIFTDQKSLIISPSQEAHISLQIPFSHYHKFIKEGNMIQVVALCELPFGDKVVVTKDIVLENPPIIIKPLGRALLHKTMSMEIRFRNPLNMTINDCVLVVEGSGLIDRQLTSVVPFLKPMEKIRFKVELTPYRTGTRQLIVNFKCQYFSVKEYHLLNVESW
ncbi:protein-glutamine gamma-glutamyltransferase E-like [Eleutherodactylus coqui]|uniref:protein-glutamine gamma-glutamyltransferase E-like n=1 Tax=Eleutherodactylus coqui TaxID=57060 RepID=UPI003462B6CC